MNDSLPTIASVLDRCYTVDSLSKICKLLKKTTLPKRRADLVSLLLANLNVEFLQEKWQQLDKLQQLALAECVYGSSKFFCTRTFFLKYQGVPNWGEKDKFSHSIQSPSLLWLFFYTQERYSHFSVSAAFIPEDIRQLLKTFVPEPATYKLATQIDFDKEAEIYTYQYNNTSYCYDRQKAVQPVTKLLTETYAAQDLLAVLHLIGSGKISVSDKTLLPSSASLKAVRSLLALPDYYDDVDTIKSYAWLLLVQAGKLTHLSGKKLQLTPAGEKALREPPEKIIKTLWQRWSKNTQFDEFRRIDIIKGQTGKAKRSFTSPPKRRRVINEALSTCPVGEWIDINDFSDAMQINGLTFEVNNNPWGLYIGESNYGNLGNEGWAVFQLRYLLCVLFEYAATLGLIDIAYTPPHYARFDYDSWGTDDLDFLSRYDGLMLFRINPLGAYCLGLSAEYSPPKLKQQAILKVLPNLDIVITHTLTPNDQFLCEQFCEILSDTVWHISERKLLDALEKGQKLENFIDFLQAKSTQELPPSASQLFMDIKQRSQCFTLQGAAQLIQCNNSELARRIANDKKIKHLCLLADNRYLVVPSTSEKRFRAALKKLGYSLN